MSPCTLHTAQFCYPPTPPAQPPPAIEPLVVLKTHTSGKKEVLIVWGQGGRRNFSGLPRCAGGVVTLEVCVMSLTTGVSWQSSGHPRSLCHKSDYWGELEE